MPPTIDICSPATPRAPGVLKYIPCVALLRTQLAAWPMVAQKNVGSHETIIHGLTTLFKNSRAHCARVGLLVRRGRDPRHADCLANTPDNSLPAPMRARAGI